MNNEGEKEALADAGISSIKPLTLKRNFVWTFTGNAVYAGCQWGMLIVLAKLGTAEMVGQFALGLAITAPVIMFTNLQLRMVQATDSRREYGFSDYFTLRLLTSSFGLAFIVAMAFIAGFAAETTFVVIGVGLAKVIESVSDVIFGLLQQYERLDKIATSMMIKGPISLAVLFLIVYLTGDVLLGVLGIAGAWLAVLVLYDLPNSAWILRGIGREQSQVKQEAVQPSETSSDAAQTVGLVNRLRIRFRFKTLMRITRLSLPLGVVMMLLSLNTNIPRYFVQHYQGEHQLGIFAALAYLVIAGDMVVNALGQSASPRLARHFAIGEIANFKRLLLKLAAIGLVIGAGGILIAALAGSSLVELIYSSEFAESNQVLVLLMLAATLSFVSTFLGYGMSAARYFRVQVPLIASVTTTSALACLVLVPRYSLKGAALALVIAALVQLVGSIMINVYVCTKRNPAMQAVT